MQVEKDMTKQILKFKVEQHESKKDFVKEMKDGFLKFKENEGLFALLLIGTLYMLVYMPINALYPLMSMSSFTYVCLNYRDSVCGWNAGGRFIIRWI